MSSLTLAKSLIRDHMRATGVTVAALARKANVSRTIADRWLDPKVETTVAGMEQCANALGIGLSFNLRDLKTGELTGLWGAWIPEQQDQ